MHPIAAKLCVRSLETLLIHFILHIVLLPSPWASAAIEGGCCSALRLYSVMLGPVAGIGRRLLAQIGVLRMNHNVIHRRTAKFSPTLCR